MPVFANQTQYAQPTDLGNLALIGGVLSQIPVPVQNAALVAASGIADSKLQARYVLPLAQWGVDLVRAVAIIAAYDLLTSKGYNPATGADPNIRERYLDQLNWLQQIADEEATPAHVIDSSVGGVPSNVTSPTDGSTVVATSGAFQAQTTPPRGWTDRGANTPPIDGGDGWWNP